MATIRTKFREVHGRWPTNHELHDWLATFVQPEVTVNEPKPKTRIKLVTVVPKYDCTLAGPAGEQIKLKAGVSVAIPERLLGPLRDYERARKLGEDQNAENVVRRREAELAILQQRLAINEGASRTFLDAVNNQIAGQHRLMMQAAKQHPEPPKPLDPKEDPNSEFYDPLSVFKETGKLPESAAKVAKKWRLFEL